MAHLRVADKLLDSFDGLDETAFVMGNMVPDRGTLCETGYIPDKMVSHFKTVGADGHNFFDWERFAKTYLTPEEIRGYDATQYSFYLGYLSHLLADV